MAFATPALMQLRSALAPSTSPVISNSASSALDRSLQRCFVGWNSLANLHSRGTRKILVQRGAERRSAVRRGSLSCRAGLEALVFDCDGVILESEDLHRRAYNAAFQEFQVRSPSSSPEPLVWTPEFYDELQNTIGGGKPKMRWWVSSFPLNFFYFSLSLWILITFLLLMCWLQPHWHNVLIKYFGKKIFGEPALWSWDVGCVRDLNVVSPAIDRIEFYLWTIFKLVRE